MFEKDEAAAWLQDAVDLSKRHLRRGNGTERVGDYGGVCEVISEWYVLGACLEAL